MWGLGQAPKTVLEKTLESPLDCKKIKPVSPKGNQSWMFIGMTDADAETLIRWLLLQITDSFAMTLMLGKIEDGRRRGHQRMRWLDGITNSIGHEFEWTLGVGDGQGGLACYSLWAYKASNTSERLNWTKLNCSIPFFVMDITIWFVWFFSNFAQYFSTCIMHVIYLFSKCLLKNCCVPDTWAVFSGRTNTFFALMDYIVWWGRQTSKCKNSWIF